MITYDSSSFGIFLFMRLHGSAVLKAFTPSILSTAGMVAVYYFTDIDFATREVIIHPYVIGCIMAAFTFLLVFRANFSYHRVSLSMEYEREI